MGPLTNITHYSPHIIQLGFSQKTHHITAKIGLQNYIILTQSPTSLRLWAKPKEIPKFLKSHYNVANFKACYDTTLLTKPVATWQYFTRSQKSFLQSPNPNFALFYKVQIPIWHLFSQSPKFLFGTTL